MLAKNLPAPHDAATARRILLGGLARDTEVAELASELAPLHPRNNTFPGEVFLHVAADALDWCEASRADPLALEGMWERFLTDCDQRQAAGRATRLPSCGGCVVTDGEPDGPVAEIGYEVQPPAEGLDVAGDDLERSDLAVLDLGHPGDAHAHRGGYLLWA